MPAAFLPDTSCMIAAVCSWHEHHKAAVNEIERRLGGRAKMIIAAPALVEAYAVLTRSAFAESIVAANRLDTAGKQFLETRSRRRPDTEIL